MSDKKFLVVAGKGAGIGNGLIFFPSQYYFAALTGREILIQDDSLIGEMCTALHCGFPHYNQIATVFPAILNQEKLNHVRGLKVTDMRGYMEGWQVVEDQLVRGDGFMEASGWYGEFVVCLFVCLFVCCVFVHASMCHLSCMFMCVCDICVCDVCVLCVCVCV
jgi:hypothetical protein